MEVDPAAIDACVSGLDRGEPQLRRRSVGAELRACAQHGHFRPMAGLAVPHVVAASHISVNGNACKKCPIQKDKLI